MGALVKKMMAFECGHLPNDEVVDLFGELIEMGIADSLQGSYGRTANALISEGYVSSEGKVLKYP